MGYKGRTEKYSSIFRSTTGVEEGILNELSSNTDRNVIPVIGELLD